MPAPEGNKNSEKWTLEKIQKFINDVYEYVKKYDDCSTLIKATIECGEYEAVLRYFKTLTLDIDFTPIKKAKDIIKNRLIEGGLSSSFNPAITIFTLKNNHGMKDKQEIKQKVLQNNLPDLSNLTYEQLIKLKEDNPEDS